MIFEQQYKSLGWSFDKVEINTNVLNTDVDSLSFPAVPS